MTRYLWALALLVGFAAPAVAGAQAVQNATLRRAQQAYDNLEYRQVVSLARAALRERLTGPERARAYELLGFTYGALDSILKAVDAFKQVVLIDPERQLDPNRVSPKAYSAFDVALRQVLLVRQLRVDSTSFVGGRGAAPIRFTVTQPARVVTRAIGGRLERSGELELARPVGERRSGAGGELHCGGRGAARAEHVFRRSTDPREPRQRRYPAVPHEPARLPVPP
jgi:tetratricopeptide (TPR) repeat protein